MQTGDPLLLAQVAVRGPRARARRPVGRSVLRVLLVALVVVASWSWLHALRGDRMPVLQAHGPQTDDQEDFLSVVQAMTDIQLAIEAKDIRAGKGPNARTEENSAEDVQCCGTR